MGSRRFHRDALTPVVVMPGSETGNDEARKERRTSKYSASELTPLQSTVVAQPLPQKREQ